VGAFLQQFYGGDLLMFSGKHHTGLLLCEAWLLLQGLFKKSQFII